MSLTLHHLARATVFTVVAMCSTLQAHAQSDCKNHFILDSPATCQWVRTSDLSQARFRHTATLLRDGSVLVLNGLPHRYRDADRLLPAHPQTAERYDPATGSWRVVSPPRWNRLSHAATLLHDGRVLVVGAESYLPVTASPEIYDPVADRWTLTSQLHARHERAGATATLLADGRVLLSGGVDMDDVPAPTEIYDPRTNRWSLGSDFIVDRYGHAVAPLPGQRVLYVGGFEESFHQGNLAASAEVFDSNTGHFSLAAAPLVNRYGASITVLPDANLVLAGGKVTLPPRPGTLYPQEVLSSTEVFDVRGGRWVAGYDMLLPRHQHTSTALAGGGVLVVGGLSKPSYEGLIVHASTEINLEPYAQPVRAGDLNQARSGHTATRLLDGSVLVVGGNGADYKPLRSAELFIPPAPRANP